MDGLFITFEGIDSSGKSTQIQFLYGKLKSKNLDVLLFREPGGTDVSDKIRAILLDINNKNMSQIAELFLYEASRAQLIEEKIIPALDEGKIVISDRLADSTLAYQGYGRGIKLDQIRQLNRIATFGVKPSITFIMDISVNEAMKRLKTKDRIESEKFEFHEKVRSGYLEMARREPDRMFMIDAERPTKEIQTRIWDIVSKRI